MSAARPERNRFAAAFGDKRGSARPGEAAADSQAAFDRTDRFELLNKRVRWTVVDLQPGLRLRFVALARSDFSGELHIAGGGESAEQACYMMKQADNFAPEYLVDLDLPADNCVFMTFKTDKGTEIETEPVMGIEDLVV